MSRTVVITQPMYLPWPGIYEQIRLADVLVYYDDVQLPRGKGFNTRVQIKNDSEQGWQWLSIPVQREDSRLQRIDQTKFVDQTWRKKHQRAIEQSYRKAPHFERVWSELIDPILQLETDLLSELCIESMSRVARYLGLDREFHRSSQLTDIATEDPTERLILICQRFGATDYVSGKGGMRYIAHDRFEAASVKVSYMDYALAPYPQLHGSFNPYVSIIDLLFHTGPEAPTYLTTKARYWRDWPELSSQK
ncbi:MAG: WbqC family protein [Deltaproteobacteria bacterium]|nr:WbqC family protein [Deltaproteobacteria bacterium]